MHDGKKFWSESTDTARIWFWKSAVDSPAPEQRHEQFRVFDDLTLGEDIARAGKDISALRQEFRQELTAAKAALGLADAHDPQKFWQEGESETRATASTWPAAATAAAPRFEQLKAREDFLAAARKKFWVESAPESQPEPPAPKSAVARPAARRPDVRYEAAPVVVGDFRREYTPMF